MKTKLIVLSLAAPLALSSCINIDKRLYSHYKKQKTSYNPVIHKNVTNFSDGLACMDQLLMSNNVRHISTLIESLNDNTEQVKAGTRDMLISAISDMSARSKKIKVIAYGKDSANMISFLKTASEGKAYDKIPQYDIRGSISQYDKSIVQADNSFGIFARTKVGGGFGKAKAASLDVMTLDLSVVNTSDMSVVPGITSKNTIAIYSRGDSLDADARINKLGTYFDMSLSRSEGKSQALRNLMELAAIELVGKLTKVPYWTCLGTKSPSEILQSKIDKEANEKAEKKAKAEQIAKAKREKAVAQEATDLIHPEDDIFE